MKGLCKKYIFFLLQFRINSLHQEQRRVERIATRGICPNDAAADV